MRILKEIELTQLSGGSMHDEDAPWVIGATVGYFMTVYFSNNPTFPKLLAGLVSGAVVGAMVPVIYSVAQCPANHSI